MSIHHPDAELLLDYAAGGTALPVSLAVAAHLSYCGECRARSERLDALGGALMEMQPPEAVSDDALAMALSRLDAPPPEAPTPAIALDAETKALIPPPLRPYTQASLKDLRWRRKGPLQEVILPVPASGYRASLFRLAPGVAAPRHGHTGREYTVVLSGSFTDDGETFGVGDFAFADPSLFHTQVGDPRDGCICFTVHDAPVRLTGVLGAIVNPFLKI